MKSAFLRFVLIVTVLMIVSALLPVCADSNGEYTDYQDTVTPWWDQCPPCPTTPVRRHTRVVIRNPEMLIETIPAQGYCYTAIRRVNVRSQPSIYSVRVMTIRAARTEFVVTARVKNSSGEIWYAVQLANGTLGYIRSDLVNTDHVILLEDPYQYETEKDTEALAASESASDVINVVRPTGAPDPTPQIIYVVVEKEQQPTPTPILVYVTPEPQAQPEPTPQVIYVYPEQ